MRLDLSKLQTYIQGFALLLILVLGSTYIVIEKKRERNANCICHKILRQTDPSFLSALAASDKGSAQRSLYSEFRSLVSRNLNDDDLIVVEVSRLTDMEWDGADWIPTSKYETIYSNIDGENKTVKLVNSLRGPIPRSICQSKLDYPENPDYQRYNTISLKCYVSRTRVT